MDIHILLIYFPNFTVLWFEKAVVWHISVCSSLTDKPICKTVTQEKKKRAVGLSDLMIMIYEPKKTYLKKGQNFKNIYEILQLKLFVFKICDIA